MTSSMRGQCPSGWLVMPPLSLTRQVAGLRLLAWEKRNGSLNQNRVSNAVRITLLQAAVVSTVTHAAQAMRKGVVNVGTKSTYTTAQRTYPNSVPSQRYSQPPQQCGDQALNYGKGKKKLAAELGLASKYGPSVRKRLKRERPGSSEDYIEAAIERRAQKEAQKVIDEYFKRIPGVKKFIDYVHITAAQTKYVESIIGRRRWLNQIMDLEEQLEHEKIAFKNNEQACWCARCRDSRAGNRRSVNTIIQGSAADVTMLAMLQCDKDPDLSPAHMLFQVHDEINFEVPEEIAVECAEKIRYHMENPGLELRVPLKAEPAIGDNWVEAH